MADVVEVMRSAMLKNGVQHALIIDDSFELEFDDFVTNEMWADFCSAMDRDEEVRVEFMAVGVTKETKSLEALATLLGQQRTLQLGINAAAALLVNFEPRMQPLLKLEQLLCSCGLSVTRRLPSEGINEKDRFDIAFIDFFLDDADHPRDPDEIDVAFLERASVRRSRALAVEVFQKTNAFIVLMSSFSSVLALEDAFQQSTEFLMKGFFKFAPKAELDDAASIAERLIRLPLDSQLRKTVCGFAGALEKQFAEAAAEASKTIRDLSIQDYAYLCNLVLRKESHPLGDYLIRIVASYLVAKLAGGELDSCKRELDQLFRQHHFPLQETPTAAFANLYSSHICEVLSQNEDGWIRHPMFGPDEAELPLATLPYLQFGDLLTKDANSEVYLVLNAGCDLMFGPERTSRRPQDAVILVPGSPRKLYEPVDTGRAPSAFTWLIIIDKEQRRVEWDFRRLTTIPHRDVEQYRAKGYKKNYRLGTVEAISIQQSLLAHIGRVGTQTPPLIASWHNCLVYCKGAEGRPVPVGGLIPHMLVGIHRRSSPNDVADQVTMPDAARRSLSEMIRKWIGEQFMYVSSIPVPEEPVATAEDAPELTKEKRREFENAVKQIERRKKWLTNMEEMLDRWKLQFDLDDVHPFPGGRSSGSGTNTNRTVLNDLVVVTDVNLDERWTGEHFVMLVLVGTQQ